MERRTRVFRTGAATPAAVRRFALDSLGSARCSESVYLASSELVSNVVRHAPHAESIEIAIGSTDKSVRIEVTQVADGVGGTDLTMDATWPRASQLTGRGLRIVDAISSDWGVDRGDTITVWCEIPC